MYRIYQQFSHYTVTANHCSSNNLQWRVSFPKKPTKRGLFSKMTSCWKEPPDCLPKTKRTHRHTNTQTHRHPRTCTQNLNFHPYISVSVSPPRVLSLTLSSFLPLMSREVILRQMAIKELTSSQISA